MTNLVKTRGERHLINVLYGYAAPKASGKELGEYGGVANAWSRQYQLMGLRESNFKQLIINLAKTHGVRFEATKLDELADIITSLSGDEVDQDEIERLVIALRRAGVIDSSQMRELLHGYLKEVYSDNCNSGKKSSKAAKTSHE